MVWLNKIKNFVLEDLWKLNLEHEENRRKAFLFKQLRILFLAAKEFKDKKVQSQASALTFYSLLSIVPVIAMAFGIAKGFGFQDKLEEEIMSNTGGSNQVVWTKLMEFSESMLDNTKGGLVAGIGILVLLWSVMKLLNSIEMSFNDIWGVKKGRSWARKFSDYLTLMLISPILLLLSGSATVYIKTQIENLADSFHIIGFFAPVINTGFRLVPYLLIWTTFSLLYMIMPNTKVKPKSAIIAGVIAGTLFQIFEWGYISLQVGVARSNAIYGSFAALPLFLVWLQSSWIIVFLGCNIAFANQNVNQYEQELSKDQLSLRQMKKLSLLLMFKIVLRFKEGKSAYTAEELCTEYKLPLRLVRPAMFQMINANLIAEIQTDDEKTSSYLPAKDIHEMRISDIIHAIEMVDEDEWEMESKEFKEIDSLYERLFEEMKSSKNNQLITQIPH